MLHLFKGTVAVNLRDPQFLQLQFLMVFLNLGGI